MVEIVYEPDSSSGRVPTKESKKRNLLNGKIITVKQTTPDDYQQKCQATKSAKRMEVNTSVPKTLTPKGYTKMQLMMSIANKQYENTVKRLKGTGKLYEDADFPANANSIGNIPGLPQIEWKRPKEINSTAEFIVGGYDRSDVQQGMLGDCWLLAVISSMADIPALFTHCVPEKQVIQGPDYVGLFKFRFWQFGQWVEVLIDDRLPVKAGTNQMIFMHSDECNEMWSALMEKAYAKLNGSYANLSGGTQGEAMEDMSGGLSESLILTSMEEKTLLRDLQKYEKRCCLMGCSVTSKEIEAKLNNGLIAGHAYSVTGLSYVTVSGQQLWLVRCRNPWGNNYEWKGAWADNSKEWNNVSPEDKKRLNVSFGGDGEFWMSVKDFMTCFTKLEVCHLGHSSLEAHMDVNGKHRLEEVLFIGEWVKGVSAGGCANFKDTFWTNPQYRITVSDPDPTDNDDMTTITAGLMQMDVRKRSGANYLTTGFALYEMDPKAEGIMKRGFFNMNRAKALSEFTNTREVVARFKVKPGSYMIVPSTYQPNEECKFILRVFTEVPVKESECDDKSSLVGLSPDVIKALKDEEATKNEDALVDKMFENEKDKRTHAIGAEQLCTILNKTSLKPLCTDSKGFTLEAARSMLAAMDNDLTGKMEYAELKELWESCQCWKVIFQMRDKDKSKNLNVTELREALQEAGFKMATKVFWVVSNRFVLKKVNAVTFEDWIVCCVRLKNCFENMKAQSKTNDGHLIFTEDDYLRLTMNQ